jgi:hypothetical protein
MTGNASRCALTGFEWRAPLGAWRWLMLGALGASAAGCGGKAGSPSNGQGGATAPDNRAPRIGTGIAGAGGGGSAGTTAAAGTGSGGSAAAPASACERETTGPGGLRICESGLMHRVTAGACSPPEPAPETIPPEFFAGADAGGVYECLRNSDCMDKPYGRCTTSFDGPYCAYACITDDDCGGEQLCLCDDSAGGGVCVTASCGVDSDCGAGTLCASNSACGYPRFVCQTSSDECAVDSDCPQGQQCILADFGEINPLVSPAGFYRACEINSCPIPGRPFLVAGMPRSAAGVERSDWCSRTDAAAESPRALAPALRAEIARGWLEQALMEHASVAAFARFALQLLSLGAPPELITDAARAMQDETRHAQDCFRLARRYAPSDIGPGPLPLDGALAEADLAAIVIGTVREGCVGETLAALEAAEALQHNEDEAARPVLERIAAEEAQHAQLAWRFVAWALETQAGADSIALRQQVRAAFAAELSATDGESAIGSFDAELARHGLLSAPVRRALRERALREVVAPCAAALLDPLRSGPRGPSQTPSSEGYRPPQGPTERRVRTSIAC